MHLLFGTFLFTFVINGVRHTHGMAWGWVNLHWCIINMPLSNAIYSTFYLYFLSFFLFLFTEASACYTRSNKERTLWHCLVSIQPTLMFKRYRPVRCTYYSAPCDIVSYLCVCSQPASAQSQTFSPCVNVSSADIQIVLALHNLHLRVWIFKTRSAKVSLIHFLEL